MKLALKTLSRLGLAFTIIPSFLFLFDLIRLETVKLAMIAGVVLWFATSPFLQASAASRVVHSENQDNL